MIVLLGSIEILTVRAMPSGVSVLPHDVDGYEGGDSRCQTECYRDNRVDGHWKHVSSCRRATSIKKKNSVKERTHDVE